MNHDMQCDPDPEAITLPPAVAAHPPFDAKSIGIERIVQRAERLRSEVRGYPIDDARSALASDIDQRLVRLNQLVAALDARTERALERFEAARAAADDRLSQLMQQTTRVGQLVGIVRQLQTVLEARAGQLRRRLEESRHLTPNMDDGQGRSNAIDLWLADTLNALKPLGRTVIVKSPKVANAGDQVA